MLDHVLDRRADDRRDRRRLAQHRADLKARVLVVDPDGMFASEPVGTSGPLLPEESGEVFLGVGPSGPWFARRGEVHGGTSLREASGLSSEQHQVVMAATAILAWHDTEPRCERCHGQTVPVDGGFSRRCLDCGRLVFPRTDPAMIVAVVDEDDRLLLGHQLTWPTGRASLLAGFTEAGESVEAAVVREVGEESQLQVTALRYLVSQPWPFPRSLMLAFVARASGEPVADGVELEWVRWFGRSDYERALGSGIVLPPGPGSVARRVIEAWRAGRLPSPEDQPLI
ncbi:NAD(+) diphosphatase [Aestuariimicrobium ganziense]|uniref:NAD(+) diphosphatase n=1 Tax=Aestuariimicrobium ganziense TaxID=2773677 RepID=UPI0019411727|nr:NAD(+) diphosphatase [Aestuariimicrobium ganziense]